MSVIRVHKSKNFTVMSNVHLRDKNLSLKSKGLLSMMLYRMIGNIRLLVYARYVKKTKLQ